MVNITSILTSEVYNFYYYSADLQGRRAAAQEEISRIRNGNVEEICETVAETRRLTRVSAVGLVTFTRVSVAAVTAEPYHFFACFRQVSVGGNKRFRKCNFMLTCAETHGNVAETLIFYISVDVIRPKRSRKYKVTFRKHVFLLFPLT